MQDRINQTGSNLIQLLAIEIGNLIKWRPSETSFLPKSSSRQVTIVGGRGRMGRLFADFLALAGHRVKIFDSNDWGQAETLVADVDLVLVCVPIDCTVETVKKLSKYLSPQTALADITSIKAPIVEAMLEHHDGAVMGLHPMFGPNINSFLSQKIVICPGRQEKAFRWFLELMQNDGAQLISATPEEHDRLMTTVQAIRNFNTFCFGALLAKESIAIERSLDFASPMYSQQVAMIQRLFCQSAPLIVDIMLATPERRATISKMSDVFCHLAQLVQQGDRQALIDEFETVREYLALPDE